MLLLQSSAGGEPALEQMPAGDVPLTNASLLAKTGLHRLKGHSVDER